MVPQRGDRPFDEEEFEREGGVFVSKSDGSHDLDCDDRCAPDDLVEDPINDEGVPGTPDDLPYDYGVEKAQPADLSLTSTGRGTGWSGHVGHTGADEDSDEPPLGRPEERELWRKQRPLIEEADDEAARYRGLSDEEIPDVESAIGEDAAEVLSETPDGASATGSAPSSSSEAPGGGSA
jgi:hypothetical protein